MQGGQGGLQTQQTFRELEVEEGLEVWGSETGVANTTDNDALTHCQALGDSESNISPQARSLGVASCWHLLASLPKSTRNKKPAPPPHMARARAVPSRPPGPLPLSPGPRQARHLRASRADGCWARRLRRWMSETPAVSGAVALERLVRSGPTTGWIQKAVGQTRERAICTV